MVGNFNNREKRNSVFLLRFVFHKEMEHDSVTRITSFQTRGQFNKNQARQSCRHIVIVNVPSGDVPFLENGLPEILRVPFGVPSIDRHGK